jgi:hypothetical protein
MVYVPAIEEIFPTEAASIEAAAVHGTERVERERAKLIRGDGSMVYGPQEHQDREAAIIEAAVAEYDRMTARYTALAETEREKAERSLVRAEGADGWEKLTDSERQVATTRQPFIREDVETDSTDQIIRKARAALAAQDRPAIWLWARYLGKQAQARQDIVAAGGSAPSRPGLAELLHDLQAVFGDPSERLALSLGLERRIEAAKSVAYAVEDGRKRINGSHARGFERMRQQMAGMF